MLVIRPLEPADLPVALDIQAANYPAFLREDHHAFASRLAVPNSYCLAAMQDGALAAYLLAHGWASHAPPPIGTVLARDIPGDILFIHDLAVASNRQGVALGRQLIDRAFDLAARDGIRNAELIAVEGAASYWRRLGFVETTISSALAAKVTEYGADARWMERQLSSA